MLCYKRAALGLGIAQQGSCAINGAIGRDSSNIAYNRAP